MLTVTKAATRLSFSRGKKNTQVVENGISFPRFLTGKKIQNELDVHTHLNEDKLYHPFLPPCTPVILSQNQLFFLKSGWHVHGLLWLYTLFLNQDPSQEF